MLTLVKFFLKEIYPFAHANLKRPRYFKWEALAQNFSLQSTAISSRIGRNNRKNRALS
jgi:hypothetical protein